MWAFFSPKWDRFYEWAQRWAHVQFPSRELDRTVIGQKHIWGGGK